ncbi:hypothetical protein B0A67_23930 [Flavobacterium aquidurense]|jgi:hypothetical protein|uniref:hypothetical protein n=1 Tax=Flavobacterium aquidurense TaxID=362413 RepID=UPI00090EFBD7|nr:hypothetical protein [Flavobacterium aquidurense]OXA65934.1 hypothetical protein B0A67_23930 [Flavobacterium aquidurense]SHH84892.1 hypothetical protein SAMN05444481_1347 [Flavobacterium frigidimaris]
MKKIIRVLGVTLSVLVLVSCSKDENNDPTTEVTESNLKGTYKYTSVSVQEAVDLNGDGVKNNDLKKEGYRTCTLDNNLEITETNYSFIMKGVSCSADETSLVFTYKLNKDEKTITLYDKGVFAGEITKVDFYNFNGLKTYNYQVYDDNLKQNVAYGMEAI